MKVCDCTPRQRTNQTLPGYWVRKIRDIATIALFGLALSACYFDDSSSDSSNGGSGNNGQETSFSGLAQKGPFQPGGSASAVALAADGGTNGAAVVASIHSDGAFELADIDWAGPTRLTMSGAYFDELTGNFTGNIKLHGAVKLPGDAKTNVNLFTHFVAARTLHLMAASADFGEARDQARDELAAIIGITAAPNSLNLSQDIGSSEHQDNGANLLLFSAATLAAGLDQAGIDAMASDFADDGRINGGGQSALGQIQQAVVDHPDLLATARDHLRNQYSVTPPDDTDGQSPPWVPGAPTGPKAAFTTGGPLQVDGTQLFDAAGSSGDGLSFAWDFGNGETATGVQTTHLFTDAGDYTVTLTVTDSDNRTDTTSQSLTITNAGVPPAAPVAEFTVSGDRMAGSELAFNASSSTGTGLSYAWDFGDGETASGAQSTHVFTDAGDYTVTLTVTDSDDRTDTTSQSLTITDAGVPPAAPVAEFTVSGDRTAGSELAFNASGSTGTGLSYAWDFGSGDTATGAQSLYAFASAGDYTVTLTVTDSADQNDTVTRTLTIAATGPQAAFATSGPASAGQAQHFDATGSTGDSLTYYWDFGDGDVGRNSQIAHIYDAGGSYTVNLTVTDADGDSDTSSQTFTVAAAPPPEAANGIIDGSVVNTENTPIEGVRVHLINAQDLVGGDRDATTDIDGATTLDNMPTGVEFVLKLTKAGYADRFVRTMIPTGASDAAVFTATMTERAPARTLNSAENGGNVTGTDGTAIELPAGALVDGSGNPVSGSIDVSLTPVDVSDIGARDAFPGSFAATDENGDGGLLLSFGVAEYYLSQGGERLQLAPGKQAVLTVPVYIDEYSDGTPVNAGDPIPLWSLDETSGQWIQEGMGTVVADGNSPTGLGFEMVVGHLSWYNCDAFRAPYRPIPHCEIAPGSGLPALEDTETCVISGNTVGDGPYSSSSMNIRGGNSRALLVPGDVDYQLVAAARNGTVTGQATIRGARGDTQDVTIVLDVGTGDGETITLPYDEESILGAADEPDVYRFTGQAGQFIGIQAGPTSSGSSLRGKLHLTTVSGQAVEAIISSGVFNSSRGGVLVAKLPVNGDYLIKAEATSGAPGDYWLMASTVASVEIDENIEGTLHRGRSSLLRIFEATAGTVVGTTNVTDSSVVFSVKDLDGNTVLSKSPSSTASGRGLLREDGTYVLRMINPSILPAAYKTAVAGIELPQPLTLDSAGRATVTGDMQVYGDYQYYSFTAARDDGIFARLETNGADGVQSAQVRLYTPNEGSSELEQLTSNYQNTSSQSTLAGDSQIGIPPVLDNVGARLKGESAGQTYLLAVHVEQAEPGRALGGYTLRFDHVKAGSHIVIDDDLSQCPDADGHSVRAAAYAIEAGGTIDVCAGHYVEHLPIYNRYQTGLTITGRSQVGVFLGNESGKLIFNNAYDELVQLESLTLLAAASEGGSNLLRGVSVKNVTINAAAGASSADIGALRLAGGAIVDGLDMSAGEVAVIAEGDDITIRNSTFNGVPGRIEWAGDNGVFENNTVQAGGDHYRFYLEGTGAQVLDNTFTVTGNQNPQAPAVSVAHGGDYYNGGADAASAVVRGNTLTTPSGGILVSDFDVTVEQNFVKLEDENNMSHAFTLAAPRYAREGEDTVKALVRNNVFDGLKMNASSRPQDAAVQMVRPWLFTDVDIINNTWRVAQSDSYCQCDHFMFGIDFSTSTLSGALPIRLINNIFVGPHRDEVDPGDEYFKAIWVPEDATIDADNNLFYQVDITYAGGGTRTGASDLFANPAFTNGLLEVSNVAPGVDNGQGTMAGGAPIPDVDYDGTPRPQHGSYDIGAHENVF